MTEGSSLNSVEILLDDFEKRDGEYTVVIKGTGISPETRVSLLGNINTGSYFRYEESGSYGEYYSILYAIETLNPKHPYVWACALIFALCLLSSYVFYTVMRRVRLKLLNKAKNIKKIQKNIGCFGYCITDGFY